MVKKELLKVPADEIGKMPVTRLKTYVTGLDERLEGGIPKGSLMMICGTAGAMKSSFAYSIIHNLVKNEKLKGIYISLEQSRLSLQSHMDKLGLSPLNTMDLVVIDMAYLRERIVSLKPSETEIPWLDSMLSIIRKSKEFGGTIVVIDSLSALHSFLQLKNVRSELFHFFAKLRNLGMTALLISEMPRDGSKYSTYGIEEFLVDGIFHLDLRQTDATNLNLYLGIIKMRRTKHDRAYYPLVFENGKFELITDRG
jgi:KaiC/GvpD/RAD55 family RecA-like ATPase